MSIKHRCRVCGKIFTARCVTTSVCDDPECLRKSRCKPPTIKHCKICGVQIESGRNARSYCDNPECRAEGKRQNEIRFQTKKNPNYSPKTGGSNA